MSFNSYRDPETHFVELDGDNDLILHCDTCRKSFETSDEGCKLNNQTAGDNVYCRHFEHYCSSECYKAWWDENYDEPFEEAE